MKFLLVFVAALTVCQSLPAAEQVSAEWSAFKATHSKQYETEEEENTRFLIYLEARDRVAAHNKLYESGLKTYKKGLNKYSDLTHEEFVKKMTGAKRTNVPSGSRYKHSGVSAPASKDWRKQGYVTPIKDQGQCGSCWSFSATGALEGQYFKARGVLPSLSEQNLLDCSDERYNNDGCDGGYKEEAWQYIIDNNGIDSESSYPYETKQRRCRYRAEERAADARRYVSLPSGDEEALLDAVASVGPIGIDIDASWDSFQDYESGIYYEPNCSSTELDHSVLVVGYGREDGTDYWLVKNSWGTSWGEEGYFKLPRNYDNHCGVATGAAYPIV